MTSEDPDSAEGVRQLARSLITVNSFVLRAVFPTRHQITGRPKLFRNSRLSRVLAAAAASVAAINTSSPPFL
jgi:hypothetical protein